MDPGVWELGAQALHVPGEGQREGCSSTTITWKGSCSRNQEGRGSLLPYWSFLLALNRRL